MNAPHRPPSFLAGRAGTAVGPVRPAQFGVTSASVAIAPALRGPHRDEPPPAGPTPEQLAAIRAEALEKVQHAVEVLRLQADRVAEQARADALEIGFQVAQRILEAELSTSPEALFALVRGALKRAGDSRRISVRLHPEDARLVGPAAKAADGTVSVAVVEVTPDAALARGDVVVDTDFGKVDGRLRTRLDELHRAATSAMEESA